MDREEQDEEVENDVDDAVAEPECLTAETVIPFLQEQALVPERGDRLALPNCDEDKCDGGREDDADEDVGEFAKAVAEEEAFEEVEHAEFVESDGDLVGDLGAEEPLLLSAFVLIEG